MQADGHAAGDGERAAEQVVRFRDLSDDVLHVAIQAAGEAQQQLPGRSEGYAASAAVEKGAAELFLEKFHLAADRGLRHVQSLRGGGEAALLGHCFEHIELSKVHEFYR